MLQSSSTLDGNTLCLFQLVEKHGKPLYEKLKIQYNRKIFFIYGGTALLEREEIRGVVENEKRSIILRVMVHLVLVLIFVIFITSCSRSQSKVEFESCSPLEGVCVKARIKIPF